MLALLEKFHEAFNQQNLDVVMALMTEDCVFENTYPPPDGARAEGQQAVRAVFEAFFRTSPGAFFEVEDMFASEDRGVIRWLYRWQTEPKGHIRGIDLYRFKEGKIAEKLSYVKG